MRSEFSLARSDEVICPIRGAGRGGAWIQKKDVRHDFPAVNVWFHGTDLGNLDDEQKSSLVFNKERTRDIYGIGKV
jgi:hypothetical protein